MISLSLSSLKTSLSVLGFGALSSVFILTQTGPVKADPLERGVQGAVGGAIIGGILNGGKGAGRGAVIGGTVGVIGGAIEDSERRRYYRGERARYYEEDEVYYEDEDPDYSDEYYEDDEPVRKSKPKKPVASKPKQPVEQGEPKSVKAQQPQKSEPQKSELVREIQAQLTKLGYNPGKADGVMGASTVEAIAAYETENGLPVTRQPSETLLQHMKKGKS